MQRLDRRHVYIFPTRHGFTLGVMLVVILLGAINYDNALGYLLAFLLGGLFLLGTTGEGPSLSYKLRYEVIDRVCRQVGDRIPILVNATDTVFSESVNLARQATNRLLTFHIGLLPSSLTALADQARGHIVIFGRIQPGNRSTAVLA